MFLSLDFVYTPSRDVAAEAQRMVELLAKTAAYRVRLKEGTERDLQWVDDYSSGAQELVEREPGASLWMRAKLYIQSILIPESLL